MNKITPSVLIVDDEPLVLEIFCDVLADAGINVVTAASAIEAMRILTDSTFDTIVTDLHLVPFDGFEIGRFAREKREGTPVLIVTGRPSYEHQQRATEEEMSFLVKPISLPYFVGHVCMLCSAKWQKKKWICESARYAGA